MVETIGSGKSRLVILYAHMHACARYHTDCPRINSGFTIDDPQISNRHIRIYSVVFDTAETSEVGGEGINPLVYAEDISTNGSWWNGQRMGCRCGSVLLSTGDVLTLANGLSLTYESKDEEEVAGLSEVVKKETTVYDHITSTR